MPGKPNRDSSMSAFSMGSQLSYAAEIGEAVPMHIQELQNVKYYAADDEESLVSDTQVPLGRLNTIKSEATYTVPDRTVSTAVENVVPPRLTRRPVSEHFPSLSQEDVPKHRFSLNISDDLDRLMANANSLKQEDAQPLTTELQSPSFGHERATSVLSSDTFETAGDGRLSTSLPDSHIPETHVLPRRPSPHSMQKARQASQQFSTTSRRSSDDGALGTIPRDAATDVTPQLATDMLKWQKEDRTIRRDASGGTKDTYDTTSIAESHDIGPETPPHQTANVSEDPVTPQRDVNELAYPETTPHDFPQAQPGTLLARSEQDIINPRDSTYDKDDEFYDIEEPVVVPQPARAKSVKDSTQIPKRKSTTRRKRKSKTDTTQLKPFSYNTLIHLLESVNGTVIGEEFETLNLPIKEKQMIEKIIDLLSRLTLDMVLDENRYEIGLQRLEKAHRVLEGFL